MAATRHLDSYDVDRIFLYEENPRHEPIDSQQEIIAHLCKDEQVFNLARNIADAGTNPLDLFGLVQLPGSGSAATKKTYQIWEGNRRLCAIKLLNDPDLAPPHLRNDFKRLASESDHIPIKKVTAVVFDDHDDLKYWMGILHDGEQRGVGRLAWDAQQKARHFGASRNRVALAVLDLAENMGLISKEERQGKLTTVQRFLNREIVKEAIGIDTNNPDDILYTRPDEDLRKQLARFVADVKEGVRVTSRHNSAYADAYGRKLASNPDISGERIEPRSIKKAATAAARTRRRVQPKKPRKPAHLEYDKKLAEALETINIDKLQSLYYSICEIYLGEHTPLLTIGVWAFVESLTALAGKKPDTDFVSYFSNQRLSEFGFGSGKTLASLRDALTRVSRNGNATKHHEIAGNFDGAQLTNDLAVITPLLIKTIGQIGPKK